MRSAWSARTAICTLLHFDPPQRPNDHAHRRAASVSHDGEAIYAAQVVAAIEAQACVENDLQTVLDS